MASDWSDVLQIGELRQWERSPILRFVRDARTAALPRLGRLRTWWQTEFLNWDRSEIIALWLRTRSRYQLWLADRRDATWLSEVIKKRKSEIRKKAIEKTTLLTPEFFNEIYYPKPRTVLVPILVVGIVLAYARALNLFTGPDGNASNLLTIESGLVAVIFPILIFIIGITGDRTDIGLKRSELILHQALLFPASAFSVIALAAIGIFPWGYSGTALVTLTTAVAIWVLYRVVRLFLNEQHAIAVGIEILKDKVQRSVHEGVDQRLGSNILFERLKALGIEYDPFRFRFRTPKHLFPATVQGMVVDVNLRKLKAFVEEAAKFAPAQAPAEGTSRSSEPRTSNPISFHPRLFEKLGDGPIFSIDKAFTIDAPEQKALERISSDVLRVQLDDGRKEWVRVELNRLREFLLAAIAEERPSLVELGVRYYRTIIEAFLSELENYGGTYSSEEARRESSSLFSEGWNIIDCVRNDVYEFINAAIAKGNIGILRDVAYMANSYCVRAVEYNDHFTFRIFSQIPAYLLQLSARPTTADSIRPYLASAPQEHLENLASYYVERPLTEAAENGREVPNSAVEFALELLTRYQDVIKVAIDQRNIDRGRDLITALNAVFGNFRPSQESTSSRYYSAMLGRTDLTEEARSQLLRQQAVQTSLEAAEQRIQDRKTSIRAGLAAWVLRLWETEQPEVLRQFANLLLDSQ